MNQKLIEIKNLNKTFVHNSKTKKVVFDDFSLDINTNENLAIIAKNGTGKTVLLETLIGLRKPESGTINYKYTFSKTPYEKIGFMFQDDTSYKDFWVHDYISLLTKDPEIDKTFLKELIEFFEVNQILNKKIDKLSGGEKQRVKLILTFVYKPLVIFLDEFDNHLDILIKEKTINFIKKYLKEYQATLVLVTHDFNDLINLCSKIAFFKDGKIQTIKSVADFDIASYQKYIAS